eukprot:1733295-Rhodomonas_salina.1
MCEGHIAYNVGQAEGFEGEKDVCVLVGGLGGRAGEVSGVDDGVELSQLPVPCTQNLVQLKQHAILQVIQIRNEHYRKHFPEACISSRGAPSSISSGSCNFLCASHMQQG